MNAQLLTNGFDLCHQCFYSYVIFIRKLVYVMFSLDGSVDQRNLFYNIIDKLKPIILNTLVIIFFYILPIEMYKRHTGINDIAFKCFSPVRSDKAIGVKIILQIGNFYTATGLPQQFSCIICGILSRTISIITKDNCIDITSQ